MPVPCFNQASSCMRARRPYLPDAAFHLVSRTIGREPWLATFRDEIVSMLGYAFARTDTVPHAFVIMSNHFHLIVRQGRKPLSSLMQPLSEDRVAHPAAAHTGRSHLREALSSQTVFDAAASATRDRFHRNPVRAKTLMLTREITGGLHWAYAGRDVPG